MDAEADAFIKTFIDNDSSLAICREIVDLIEEPLLKILFKALYRTKRRKCRKALAEEFITADECRAQMMRAASGAPSAKALEQIISMKDCLAGRTWCEECRLEVSNCMCANIGVDSAGLVIYFD